MKSLGTAGSCRTPPVPGNPVWLSSGPCAAQHGPSIFAGPADPGGDRRGDASRPVDRTSAPGLAAHGPRRLLRRRSTRPLRVPGLVRVDPRLPGRCDQVPGGPGKRDPLHDGAAVPSTARGVTPCGLRGCVCREVTVSGGNSTSALAAASKSKGTRLRGTESECSGWRRAGAQPRLAVPSVLSQCAANGGQRSTNRMPRRSTVGPRRQRRRCVSSARAATKWQRCCVRLERRFS